MALALGFFTRSVSHAISAFVSPESKSGRSRHICGNKIFAATHTLGGMHRVCIFRKISLSGSSETCSLTNTGEADFKAERF